MATSNNLAYKITNYMDLEEFFYYKYYMGNNFLLIYITITITFTITQVLAFLWIKPGPSQLRANFPNH